MKKSKFRQDKNPYKSYEKKPADSTVWKHLTWVHAIAALAVVCAVLLAVILGVHHFHVKYPGGMPEAIAARQEKRDTKKTAKEEKKEAKQTAKAEKKANRRHGKTDEEDIAADTDLSSEEEEPEKELTIEDVWADDTREAVDARGLYLTAYSAADENIRDYVLNLLDETEINTVVITIKSEDGLLAVDFDIPLAEEIGAVSSIVFSDEESLKDLLNIYKEHGAYTVARIACFRDDLLAQAREDCSLHWNEEYGGDIYCDSQGYYWLDPGNDTVRQYIADISQAACDAGFDEIQYDYVRFPTTYIGRVDYYGGDGYYLADGYTYNEEAAKIRQDTITSFIEYACRTLVPQGVFVSADVYGTIINNDEDSGNVGQDYAAMSQWLDYICPMVYPSHYSDGAYNIDYPDTEPYELVSAAMGDSKEALSGLTDSGKHCATVRPWLQAFTATWVTHHITYGGTELRKQIDAIYDAGYNEWLIWQSSGEYEDFRSGLEDK